MSDHTFAVPDNLGRSDPRPIVFFGGLVSRFFTPKLSRWYAGSNRGARVELITNGTLLDEAAKTSGLIDAGLDMLWVSWMAPVRRAMPMFV